MSQHLDPIAATTSPRENLIRYLLTAYPLRDPHLRYGFKQLLEQPGNITQHPYLEGVQPYRSAKAVEDLVSENILHPETARLFNPTRPLYQHQEAAIRSVVEKDQNIVVATGTGSGKTECFLIPMMDHLLKNPGTGVQALILYPMNALVNDQVKRLRQLLCKQGDELPLIRFGFYTSRTETDPTDAVQALKEELEASEREELLELFTEEERQSKDLSRPELLVKAAQEKIMRVQAVSRREIWENPPQILVTNYSMLEHMLIRPTERQQIFERSYDFKLLVIDEAHSYNGSTGTEVAMLIKRLRAAVGIESQGILRGIATSATLGNREDPKVVQQITEFAKDLFGESFEEVIWGDRVTVPERLGDPYPLPEGMGEIDVYEYWCDLQLPLLDAPIEDLQAQLEYLVPQVQLEEAIKKSNRDIHRFLWFAFKGHPTVHRLIDLLAQGPQPWDQIARSSDLWALPQNLDGSLVYEEEQQLETALARLVQLGTLARLGEDLPLLPVRLHLLFRSIEGLYACVNSRCQEAPLDPEQSQHPNRYGKVYLNSRRDCDCCGAPVIELASCRKCGQAYGLTYRGAEDILQTLPRSLQAAENSSSIHVLTNGPLDSVTEDEPDESLEDTDAQQSRIGSFTIQRSARTDGWIGVPSNDLPTVKTASEAAPDWTLHRHRPKQAKNQDGGNLSRCPACNASRARNSAIGRFVSYTDAPLEVMLDSLFELLPKTKNDTEQSTKRKLLTFSDGRQDAAFFAADFQRTHTETLYRQLVWETFASVQEDSFASIKRVEERLSERLQTLSIPNPDREIDKHHKSYIANDKNEEIPKNPRDCKQSAQARARELLLREFGLPSSRRFSMEALGLLACHVEFYDDDFVNSVAQRFELSPEETQIFLTGLTDVIRLMGAVDLQDASRYFPETGGLEGGVPARLDSKGRSQTYLKLRRNSDEKYAAAFLWRKNKDGQPSVRQNQIVSYYRDFLGALPSEEDLLWLFDELLRSGILVKYKDGRQLNWQLLTLQKTETDWHQCNTCQQIFHVPGLNQTLDEALNGSLKANISQCPASGCEGTLGDFDPERMREHHYRHIIRERSVLPLRSQEHTAQLETDELAQRESYFRQGKINLLSCSTTLEMGVDIGELQAVAMRNFPPHVSNYQQRAGRAGRRTDGVAVTLMYGQRRPHDRYYFEQPAQLINGKNQVPRLDPGNFEIQRRHIRAELLAKFLRDEHQVGAEKVTLAQFLALPDNLKPLDQVPPEAVLIQFLEWLSKPPARALTQQWLDLLDSKHLLDDILQNFEASLNEFRETHLQDWNGLTKMLQEIKQAARDADDENDYRKQKGFEFRRDRLQSELGKIQKRQLHEELAKASILPIYGFPIDVVQLLTRESKQYGRSGGKHRLQRDRRLALGEYSPGQEVVVDDQVHTSAGVMRPDDLSSQYYWVCQSCNYFMSASSQQEIMKRLSEDDPKCPVCSARPSRGSEKQPKLYKVPKAFMTDWVVPPKVTPYDKPMRQLTSQVFLAKEGDNAEAIPCAANQYELILSQGGQFFLSNQGPIIDGRGFKNKGFALCRFCGRDLSDDLRKQLRERSTKKGKKKPLNLQHNHPITGRSCPGRYSHTHLAHVFRSDFLKIRFTALAKPPKLFGTVTHHDGGGEVHSNPEDMDSTPDTIVTDSEFWRSLTYALLAAAAQVIDVPRSELDGLFQPVKDTDEGTAEIVIYDNVPGGAGYSKRIADQFPEVLEQAYQLTAFCSCGSSCYDCLRTYTNQIFHQELNRVAIAKFLSPITDQVQPDEDLKAFAPNSHRSSLTQVAAALDGYLDHASAESILYLPQVDHPLTLKQLSQLIYALEKGDTPLEIIVTRLPEATADDQARFLRKRLAQWIDQGLLRLYEHQTKQLPTLCLSSRSSHRIALQLRLDKDEKPLEWFQTRSEIGVNTVLSNLQQMRDRSRLILAKSLEDPDTLLISPTPKWPEMNLDSLRHKLGLTQILKGSQVQEITYTDRYLDHEGATFLAQLLQGEWLSESSHLSIQIQQSKDEYRERDTSRKSKVERSLARILSFGADVKMREYRRRHSPTFPHRRELKLKTDQQTIRVLFDKGMDFLSYNVHGQYSVKEETYVVIYRS